MKRVKGASLGQMPLDASLTSFSVSPYCRLMVGPFFQYELDDRGYPNSRIFTVLFIFIGNFIFTNLFIGVVLQASVVLISILY